MGFKDFPADALLLFSLLVNLLSESVHAQDVNELRNNAKLPFRAESKPVEDTEDVEQEEDEGDDDTGQEDPLDNVDISANLLDGTETIMGEESNKREGATNQHQEGTDAIKNMNVLNSCLEHNVDQSKFNLK